MEIYSNSLQNYHEKKMISFLSHTLVIVGEFCLVAVMFGTVLFGMAIFS